ARGAGRAGCSPGPPTPPSGARRGSPSRSTGGGPSIARLSPASIAAWRCATCSGVSSGSPVAAMYCSKARVSSSIRGTSAVIASCSGGMRRRMIASFSSDLRLPHVLQPTPPPPPPPPPAAPRAQRGHQHRPRPAAGRGGARADLLDERPDRRRGQGRLGFVLHHVLDDALVRAERRDRTQAQPVHGQRDLLALVHEEQRFL